MCPEDTLVVRTFTAVESKMFTTAAPTRPSFVPISQLSRRPQPPSSLANAILVGYPYDLQQQRIEGQAVLHLRIQEDGSPTLLRPPSETYRGFGTACRLAIERAGRWSIPLDDQGEPVATLVRFVCRYSVD